MCSETIRLSSGTRLTGELVEHVGAGCVIIRVDGRNYFGVKDSYAVRREQREAVDHAAAR